MLLYIQERQEMRQFCSFCYHWGYFPAKSAVDYVRQELKEASSPVLCHH